VTGLSDSNWCSVPKEERCPICNARPTDECLRPPPCPAEMKRPVRLADSYWCKCPDGNPYCDGSILLHGKWCAEMAVPCQEPERSSLVDGLADSNWCKRP
jgi:hypothetical protein